MFADIDSNFLVRTQALLTAGGKKKAIAALGLQPDFTRRRAFRSLDDGRYKFSRCISTKQHNQPRTLERIFELNDAELFDLEVGPG